MSLAGATVAQRDDVLAAQDMPVLKTVCAVAPNSCYNPTGPLF